METGNLNKHISGQFNVELENVRSQVLAMGGLVEQQLENALLASNTGDKDLAREVIENDRKVNELEVNIDQECVRIIAKRQPTAGDLRLMMAIIKTITDLERIGDMAEHAAQTVLHADRSLPDVVQVNLEALGEQIIRMLRDVLDAFARMDADAAYRVHSRSKKVDSLHEGLVRQLLTYMMGDSRSIPFMLEVQLASRSLGRVGDHCKNIAEYIIYFVKGTDVRHTSPEEIKRLLKQD
ncbi:phosphate signaling complex protein PhoU [Echinimonas agarilytica]|uniref:Phosphate-specific transport system accessory protein PhoU n=1 Tax=Echinimonas agarilytica TaxID=1215918 RepID=A0AA42B7T6_9GAMM|nr:phosphate signaling complex protein PhoU [Echinimonas agarilytica]